MATPKESDKKNVLNNVVLYCCCGFFFVICGYGLYRQHVLEERVLVLEKQFKEFKRTVEIVNSDQSQNGKEMVLKRETRDAECICPAGKYQEIQCPSTATASTSTKHEVLSLISLAILLVTVH